MIKRSRLLHQCEEWLTTQNKSLFPFQKECFNHYLNGKSGVLIAPTGMGKTYALTLPFLMDFSSRNLNKTNQLEVLWITPLRALASDITEAINQAAEGLDIPFNAEMRNGDTTTAQRQKQIKSPPNCLVTTPESVHILLASKKSKALFKNLKCIVVDEWHDFLSTKRGVQVELILAHFKNLNKENNLRTWGISATIGNVDEAKECLWGKPTENDVNFVEVRCKKKKKLELKTILPTKVDVLPWAGHMGIALLEKVPPILAQHRSTLIFTNTRNQCEVWYKKLLDQDPGLAGKIAMHHGSLSRELRTWVEESLHAGDLKAVVSTSSLDLGVDFRPVDAVIQIGSPKGVSRFVQRAGRSGHSPFAKSKAYFLPTNSMELIEASSLKRAVKDGIFEARLPVRRAFDVLVQYLVTLAVGSGFYPEQIVDSIKNTYCFNTMTDEEWAWALNFITKGGKSLEAYDEFNKVSVSETGLYMVESRKIAMKHRLSIGTIVSETSMAIRYGNGGLIGHVEEFFISRLNLGNRFVFGGTVFELLKLEGLNAYVKKSNRKSGAIPSWMGGRMSLTSEISAIIRQEISDHQESSKPKVEFKKLQPLLDLQRKSSSVPKKNEILLEWLESSEGYHLFVYPFEGRMINEGIALLIAYRLAKDQSISFSVAMNDYGFELLSNKAFYFQQDDWENLISTQNLMTDILQSTNHSELARKRFREIAAISGLTFKGYPNKQQKDKHLHANSSLFFEVFSDYEPDHLLLTQAYEEVIYLHMDEHRLRKALKRIKSQRMTMYSLILPSPFSFPIMADRLRDNLSTESLHEKVAQIQKDYQIEFTSSI